MTNETTSESPFPTSGAGLSGAGSAGLSGMGGTAGAGGLGASGAAADAADSAHGTVSRMAQRAHEAVDRMEQALGSGGERVMDWQQERANPLAAVGMAFLAGLIFGRVFMR